MAWKLEDLQLNFSPETKALNQSALDELQRANKTPPPANDYERWLQLLSDEVYDCNPEAVAELERLSKETKGVKKNKFNAIPEVIDGRKFPSRKEAREYCNLRILERAEKIKDLQLQPKFILQRANKAKGVEQVRYTPDFKYFDLDLNTWVIVETKGVQLADFIVRKNLFLQWLSDNHPDWIYVIK